MRPGARRHAPLPGGPAGERPPVSGMAGAGHVPARRLKAARRTGRQP
ncbi:hypothetical protein C882_1533 [Caenispirillum salinarum AK4]|uniref:Uncharacterized protein n=1 Tax=Caenispirillum salinarum AK4 TaxID=1238182 RepID=K9HX17_9PROT|nr:hypothetical protein C882_1533 [Caenispirillum salinarum AK4]